MREHVGAHILKGHIPDVINACGCCGGLGCTATLQVRNKKEQPEVDCKAGLEGKARAGQGPDPEPWSMKPKEKSHMDGVVAKMHRLHR